MEQNLISLWITVELISAELCHQRYSVHVVTQILLKHVFTQLSSAKILISLQIFTYLWFHSEGFCKDDFEITSP